jgi:hypothetical protein
MSDTVSMSYRADYSIELEGAPGYGQQRLFG